MLYRAFLALTAYALALLLAGWILQKLAFESLAELADTIGVDTLLAGFALPLAAGVFYLLKTLLTEIGRYFSRREAARRKLLFAEDLRKELEQRRASELRQLDYFQTLKRLRLLRANDSKHVHLLAKSLYRQLRAARGNMPKPLYRELKQAVNESCRRRDSEALLALQKQIASYQA